MGNKRKYFAKDSQKSNKKSKYMFDEKVKLGPNMKGFLITYNCKFTFLVNEARKLIQQFSETNEKSVESTKSSDIEKELQEELNSLNKMDKQLSILDTGAKYTLFINQPQVNPNKVVESIFEHIEKSQKPLGRFVQRFLPVLSTCKSYLDELEKCLVANLDDLEVIKSSLEGSENAKPFKYCCVFKTSNNNVLARDDVFKLVGGYMQSKNKLNKVDFDNPDYVLLVHVICNLCYVSFVKKFSEYRKYNLIEMGTKFNKIESKTKPDDKKEEPKVDSTDAEVQQEEDNNEQSEENGGEQNEQSEETS